MLVSKAQQTRLAAVAIQRWWVTAAAEQRQRVETAVEAAVVIQAFVRSAMAVARYKVVEFYLLM